MRAGFPLRKIDSRMYIVADIGGTKTRIAGSDDLKNFSDPVIVSTPQAYEEGIAVFTETVLAIAASEPIKAVMAGVAGVFSHDKKMLLRAPHLPLWSKHAFAADLEASLQTNVHIENDTALVGLGEVAAGAGKGASILAYITVSTGVNGARIVEGLIDHAHLGFEVGGQYLSMGADARTLEELVSGSAIAEKYAKPPRDIEKDSPLWEELAGIFAYGLHNTILHWSPDRVVLGGSMFNKVGIPVERVYARLAEIMRKFPELPPIVHASLDDLGGIHGGLARLRQIV
jgi:predicted NBD/HSP70 family sugar kinase